MVKKKSPLKKQPDLSIVIPAYREELRIGRTLDHLSAYLKSNKTIKNLSVEVIVVAADAIDKTDSVVLSKKSNFSRLILLKPGPKVGKGRDVQYGMLKAKGAAVMFMDADLATPLRFIESFYKTFLKGGDVVIATRNLKKHHPSKLRRSISNIGNLLFRIFGGVWVEDSQCGFKMFSSVANRICFEHMTIMGWGFDMEILAIAKVNHQKIITHRINDWVSVPGGVFLDGMLASSLTSLNELLLIFINRMRGIYKDS